jgi:RNA polymerase sigma-70 factor (sigma-E family)
MGDPSGFDAFVGASGSSLLRTAWLLTGSWSSAQDLVQTALMKAWRHWPRVERAGDPEAYVRRIVVTTYATWWRRRWRAEVPHAEVPDQGAPDDVDEAATRLVVSGALGALPRGQRAVVVLRHLDDLSEAETAAALGVSVGTVKSQHARAMARLRADVALATLWSGEEDSHVRG